MEYIFGLNYEDDDMVGKYRLREQEIITFNPRHACNLFPH